MLWSAFCPKQHSRVTHLVFGSASMCIIITYLVPGWEGGSKGKETRSFPCACATALLLKIFCPGSSRSKKVPCVWAQKSHCCSSEPKACVTGSKDCSFKPLPKHTEGVKQTETQEWRKQSKIRQDVALW